MWLEIVYRYASGLGDLLKKEIVLFVSGEIVPKWAGGSRAIVMTSGQVYTATRQYLHYLYIVNRCRDFGASTRSLVHVP